MSEPQSASEVLQSVDALCDEFERAWKAGVRRPLDDWLRDAGPLAPATLPELAALELDYRLRSGEQTTAADYFDRYPKLRDDPDTGVRLIGIEFRTLRGRDPSLTEDAFRRRYADHARLPEWSNGPWVDFIQASVPTATHTPVGLASTPPVPIEPDREVTDFLAGLRANLSANHRPEAVGRFGPFDVDRLLGAGGMGIVLRGWDPKLQRAVALKVMRPAVAQQTAARARFQREAEAMAAVHHRHVAIVHHVDEADGVPYIVMPLMPGQSLKTRIAAFGGQPLPFDEVLRIGRETAEGLAAAHARGLIHRDVKPDNVWLEETDRGPTVRVLDFGLARPVDGDPTVSRSGAVMGTPVYMSPEQARGHKLDARSDLFSLGVVLYELASGRRPFHGESLTAVLIAVATEPPRPLSERNPGLPGGLADLIHRLLAKDPSERPSSAADVAIQLDQLAAAPAGLPTEPYRPAEAGKRSRMLTVAVGVGLVAVGLAVVVASRWDKLTDDRGSVTPVVPTRPAIPPAEPLRVISLEVTRFRKVGPGQAELAGVLGRDTFTAVVGDQATVTATLTRPGYAYIVAFRPDGVAELVYPEDATEMPPLTDTPRYPSKSRGVNYGLTDGAGFWAFVAVASADPLPPFRQVVAERLPGWTPRPGRPTEWTVPNWTPAAAPGIVWIDNGDDVEAVSATRVDRSASHGEEDPVAGKTDLVKAGDQLMSATATAKILGVGFTANAGQ